VSAAEALDGVAEVDSFEAADEGDHVAAGAAAEAEERLRVGEEAQVGPAAILVEGAPTDERAAAAA